MLQDNLACAVIPCLCISSAEIRAFKKGSVEALPDDPRKDKVLLLEAAAMTILQKLIGDLTSATKDRIAKGVDDLVKMLHEKAADVNFEAVLDLGEFKPEDLYQMTQSGTCRKLSRDWNALSPVLRAPAVIEAKLQDKHGDSFSDGFRDVCRTCEAQIRQIKCKVGECIAVQAATKKLQPDQPRDSLTTSAKALLKSEGMMHLIDAKFALLMDAAPCIAAAASAASGL